MSVEKIWYRDAAGPGAKECVNSGQPAEAGLPVDAPRSPGLPRLPRVTIAPLRVCLVYDCLSPWTVGGQEQWLRRLADTLVRQGHQVTFLTRQQWPDDAPPQIPGVEVVAVSRAEELYGPGGARRPAPPLRFAVGVAAHLARRRGAYDVLHTCGFPYFHLPALRLALAGTGIPVVVDWIELWSAAYWRSYVGGVGGALAQLVQSACLHLTPTALAYSDLHADRLVASGTVPLRPGGLGPDVVVGQAQLVAPSPPRVLSAGRQIREKRPDLVVRAVAVARGLPGLEALTADVLGDGPERPAVQALVASLGLGQVVRVPGFVPAPELAAALGRATCLVHPSRREGFGMVVVEAAALGTPVVLVDGPDNAARELLVPGVNGELAQDDSPEALAAAIATVHAGGAALRASTARWYAAHAPRLAASASAERVSELYARLVRG